MLPHNLKGGSCVSSGRNYCNRIKLDISKTDKTIGILVKKVLEAFFDMVNREKILEIVRLKSMYLMMNIMLLRLVQMYKD